MGHVKTNWTWREKRYQASQIERNRVIIDPLSIRVVVCLFVLLLVYACSAYQEVHFRVYWSWIWLLKVITIDIFKKFVNERPGFAFSEKTPVLPVFGCSFVLNETGCAYGPLWLKNDYSKRNRLEKLIHKKKDTQTIFSCVWVCVCVCVCNKKRTFSGQTV